MGPGNRNPRKPPYICKGKLSVSGLASVLEPEGRGTAEPPQHAPKRLGHRKFGPRIRLSCRLSAFLPNSRERLAKPRSGVISGAIKCTQEQGVNPAPLLVHPRADRERFPETWGGNKTVDDRFLCDSVPKSHKNKT